MFALLLASCTVIVDDNNRVCGMVQQPVHVGAFGPGHPYESITGRRGQHPLVQGSFSTNSLCDPHGFQARGGIRVNPIPQGWGQVNPCGYRPQPCPSNVGYGGGYGGYPQYQPAPMFGYQPQQPPVYRYYQNTNNSATATTGGSRPQPGRYNPRTGRWE